MNFGMLVERAEPIRHPEGALVLLGPVLGPVPLRGTGLRMLRDQASTLFMQFAGLMQFHGGSSQAEVGIVVTGVTVHRKLLQDAIVLEANTSCHRYSMMSERPLGLVRAAARFDLCDGQAFGLLRIRNVLMDAWILGPDPGELQPKIKRIVTLDGIEVASEVLRPPTRRSSRTRTRPSSRPWLSDVEAST
jgi:hypothetical protein